jgi:hypothetical protein
MNSADWTKTHTDRIPWDTNLPDAEQVRIAKGLVAGYRCVLRDIAVMVSGDESKTADDAYDAVKKRVSK